MLARPADSRSFVPEAHPQLAVAADGSLGAVQEPSRIGVIELSGGVAFAEIGVDPAAEGTEIAWVGTPPRLLVVSRFATQSTIHLLDPHGPRTVAEIRMESPIRLFATVGNHALVGGAVGAAILATGESTITPYQFPTRMPPRAAGAVVGLFAVAVAGAIEEWDPQARMPRRRFRLPHAATISALGGSDRVLWMTTQHDPARIDVIPLVNRGQPKSHELPEPIGAVSGHPRSDLLACVGATTGTVYLVDLDGRAPLRVIETPGLDRVDAAGLVVGRGTAILAAQMGRPIAIVSVDGRESVPEIRLPPPRPVAEPIDPGPPPARSSLVEESAVEEVAAPPRPVSSLFGPQPARTPPPPAPVAAAPQAEHKQPLSERISGWRNRGRPPPSTSGERPAAPAPELAGSWRDEVVAWTRAIAAGTTDRGAPASPEIDALAARFALPPEHAAAIILAYGAHLVGERGAAPVDLARVLGGRWAEALGTGELAARGVMRYAGSRVRLVEQILRALDGLPPLHGVVVGTPGPVAALGPCAVVGGEADGAALAQALIPRVASAILVAHPRTEVSALVLEARARRAVPLVLAAAVDVARFPADEPVILVVPDSATAEQLGIPLL